MQKVKLICIATLVIIISMRCNNSNNQTKKGGQMETKETTVKVPTADKFVTSPLRNRIKLELNAPVSDVWPLVGDPGRMPEYSAGLQKVETQKDASGKFTGFTCYFKPVEEGQQGITHHIKMVWYEQGTGWASLDEEPNAFGLQQSLTILTFESKDNKTIVTWEMNFNAANEESIRLNVSALEQALNDIAQNLIKRFSGRVLENYADAKN